MKFVFYEINKIISPRSKRAYFYHDKINHEIIMSSKVRSDRDEMFIGSLDYLHSSISSSQHLEDQTPLIPYSRMVPIRDDNGITHSNHSSPSFITKEKAMHIGSSGLTGFKKIKWGFVSNRIKTSFSSLTKKIMKKDNECKWVVTYKAVDDLNSNEFKSQVDLTSSSSSAEGEEEADNHLCSSSKEANLSLSPPLEEIKEFNVVASQINKSICVSRKGEISIKPEIDLLTLILSSCDTNAIIYFNEGLKPIIILFSHLNLERYEIEKIKRRLKELLEEIFSLINLFNWVHLLF